MKIKNKRIISSDMLLLLFKSCFVIVYNILYFRAKFLINGATDLIHNKLQRFCISEHNKYDRYIYKKN